MKRTLPSMDALLREVCTLRLLSPSQAKSFAATRNLGDDSAECARQLVEAGLLTAYQAQQVLAGEGRGLRVGPYVLLERLGAGGMGQVYKAEHRLLKRVVALKIASRKVGGTERTDALMRFRREVEAAGRLRHPGIVTAYDAGQSRGHLYLAMEYVEGIDLERHVRANGPLSIELACAVVRQTAEALGYAHERGLIHRDVKPANLMLASPGDTVKLLDLGLARLTDSSFSIQDEPCGTPDFMAPEWGRDPAQVDGRGDLYSLGCTFYFLLTGQVPFPGGNGAEKILRHSLDQPAPVRSLRPDTPESVALIVERLMARESEQRYPAASAVVEALASLDAAEPVTPSSRVESPQIGSKRISARPRFFSVSLAAILCGIVAAGGARWLVTPHPHLPQPRNVSQSRKEPLAAPIQIEGRSIRFATLEQAIAEARDGDTITIHSAGPFTTGPLNGQGKAMTIRAGSSVRPRFLMKPSDDPWQALLRTDRPLTLEGVDLDAGEEPSGQRALTTPILRCEGAPLHLTNCRLKSAARGTALVARRAGEVIVHACRLDAGSVGFSVEVGATGRCRLELVDSEVTVHGPWGAAVSLWAPETLPATSIELEMRGNTIRAGRIASLRALPAGVKVRAHGNRFTFGEALLSYTGYADRNAWRDGTIWEGEDNSYGGPAARVRFDGKPVSPVSQGSAR